MSDFVTRDLAAGTTPPASLIEALPEIGSKWVSLDPRDDGLIVTVLAVSDRYIQIKRFNKTQVRTDRFHRAYRAAAYSDTTEAHDA